MNPSSDKVLRYLGGNENIAALSIDELQKLADESPYFAIAHLLLAEKLKNENQPGFLKQAQKTALYFSSPHWLHYQLSGQQLGEDLLDETDVVVEASANFTTNEAFLESKEVNIIPDQISGKPEVDIAEQETQPFANEQLTDENIEKQSQPEEEVAALVPEPDKETEVFLNQLITVVPEAVFNENKELLSENHPPAELGAATEVLEEMAGVTSEPDEVTEAFLDETQESNEAEEKTEPDEHERMFQNIKAMLDATSEDAEADIKNAVIPIDPYYTIDYFASQGIKLDLEQNPKDELGQHLKKFTQWLKHMKKLGPEDATEVIQRTDNEADIQKIAETSNTVREVVTEAMATVLEKQGKNDKAIELYKKLSFLNPDKSAYFATKIKNLKGI